MTGATLRFDDTRIGAALTKAFTAVHGELGTAHERSIAQLGRACRSRSSPQRYIGEVKIYEIQSVVEHVLLEAREYDVAQAYIDYRVQP